MAELLNRLRKVSRGRGRVAKLPSDELKSSKGLVEGAMPSILATNPVFIRSRDALQPNPKE
jgi:hypothetical protein